MGKESEYKERIQTFEMECWNDFKGFENKKEYEEMKHEEESNKKAITRRDFLKGASLGVAAVAGSSVLSGCKPKDIADAPNTSAGEEASGSSTSSTGGTFSFETPPDPIPESEITETVTADVVVIGAGVSGLMAAQAAVDAGVKTILIEKSATYNARGGHNAALGSKLQKENGIDYDPAQVVRNLSRWSSNRADERLLWLWANNCNDVINDLIDLAEANDTPVMLGGNDLPNEYYPEYKTIHMFGGMDEKIIAGLIEADILEKGVEIRYETPAAQLEREESGRVTGVIAKSGNSYIRLNASKGIVLATGDYGNDPEMVQRYCPKAADVDINVYVPAVNTGDGHKMGMWVGAAMQEEEPHTPMVHNLGGLMMTSNPFLKVNALGQRYANEDVPIPYMANRVQLLPDNISWMVFDSTYGEDLAGVTPGFGRSVEMSDRLQTSIDDMVEQGTSVFKADTIEALAEAINVPADNLVATIKRYNEFADMGEDKDFGKGPSMLTAVDTAPYYAAKVPMALLVVLGGLNTTPDLQVLDGDGNIIEGLYASGNVVGGMFANDYPVIVPGLSHSRALVFGRVAGKNAANA